MSKTHLSDEQFGELLAATAGDRQTGDQQTTAHLQTCAACRNELQSIRAAVGDLRELSLQWAEQRAVRVQAPTRWTMRWRAVPGWGAAVAAVLFCGIAIGVHEQNVVRNHVPAQIAGTEVSQAEPPVAPSEDELAQDNRLLRSIDDELSQQVRPQVSASELTSSRTIRRPISREVAN
jgi:hypothetical protein